MRLWTIHPQHLDAKGLVALWREALLAQKVLQGRTRGYKHHPQLFRFAQTTEPVAAIASYLAEVHAEAVRRDYNFDVSKIGAARFAGKISETRGQLRYEWEHLQRKLKLRDPVRHAASLKIQEPSAHPLFRLVAGAVRDWEVVS
jgi:hypothetical protein